MASPIFMVDMDPWMSKDGVLRCSFFSVTRRCWRAIWMDDREMFVSCSDGRKFVFTVVAAFRHCRKWFVPLMRLAVPIFVRSFVCCFRGKLERRRLQLAAL